MTLYGVRRCSDADDVADLVAETFLVALQASGRYVPETDTALPWLFGIAHLLFTSSEEDAVAAAIDAARLRLSRARRHLRQVLDPALGVETEARHAF